MKIRVAFAVLVLAVPALAVDLSGVLEWSMPEGKVARVEVGDEMVWPAIPYVTNGLIAYWDGAWNSGIGMHDAGASNPTELVAGLSTTLDGTIPVEGNAFLFGSGNISFQLPAFNSAINEGNATVEIVLAKDGDYVGNGGFIAFGGRSTRGFWIWQSSGYLISSCSYHAKSGEYTPIYFDADGTNTLAFQLTTAVSNKYFCNGLTAGYVQRYSTDLAGNADGYVGRLPTYNQGVAKVFAIRIYARALSDDEIALNSVMDTVRFHFAPVSVYATAFSLSPHLSPAIQPATFAPAAFDSEDFPEDLDDFADAPDDTPAAEE